MKALIIGASGQDSSYLGEFLLQKKYDVVGVRRRSSSGSLWRLSNCLKNPSYTLVEGDITDFSSILNLLDYYKPDEIYNLSAQSNVGISFNQPGLTWDITAKGVMNLLEAAKFLKYKGKIYQTSSSEMFGASWDWIVDKANGYDYLCWSTTTGLNCEPTGGIKVQNERTKFSPQSPYAIAKLAAHNMIKLYRESYGLWCVGGILFNHESPRRGINFVTRKITSWFKNNTYYLNNYHMVPGWHIGTDEKLKLGNLSSMRDWGYAPEYVEAMWLMLQQDKPKDYVIGTGETHTVEEFLNEVLDRYKFPINSKIIEIDENCKRPAEVPYLRADASLAEKELGWKPKTKFKELVQIMCEQENGLS